MSFILLAAKLKGVDLDAPGNINGVSVMEVEMESFEEKPWRKPGLYCVFVWLSKFENMNFFSRVQYFASLCMCVCVCV